MPQNRQPPPELTQKFEKALQSDVDAKRQRIAELKQKLEQKRKQSRQAQRRRQDEDEGEDLADFIVDDDLYGEEENYDLLDSNANYFKNKNYVFKEYSDESDGLEEANYDQIEKEEFISGVIGEREDQEQMEILRREEQAAKARMARRR